MKKKLPILPLLAAAGWLVLYFGVQYATVSGYAVLYLARYLLGALLPYGIGAGGSLKALETGLTDAAYPLQFLSYLLFLLAAASAFWAVHRNPARECGLVRAPAHCFLWPVNAGFWLYFGVNIALLFLALPASWTELLQQYTESLTADGTGWYLFFVLAAAPFVEEIVFRGLIFRSLRQSLPPAAAILLSAAVFGLIHLSGGWLLVLPAFVLGVINATALEKSGSLLPCITAHCAANASALFQVFFTAVPSTIQQAAACGALLLSAVCLVALQRTPADRGQAYN